MEQTVKLGFKSVMLCLLVSSCVYSKSECYYVRPTRPQDVDCPGNPCQHLKHYSTENLDESDTNKNDTVTMILTEGYHSVKRESIYNFGSPINSLTIQIIGNGQSSNSVTVDDLETGIIAKNMILESFTAIEVYVYIDELVVDSQTTNISILNCVFIESSMILTNVHLTIKDSNFSECTSTAIMLYSSTLTTVGQVRFLNNKGFQGGALMLIGTAMQIAKKTHLLFQENYAENTGGGIFVVHPQMLINAHSYYSSCFYRLLDYDTESNYSIKFINNSAVKGGDHIYGASLKSGCSLANDLDSYEVFRRFFLGMTLQFQQFQPMQHESVSVKKENHCVMRY